MARWAAIAKSAGLRHARRDKGWFRRLSFATIGVLTSLMIWLSTWGDLAWMGPEMRRAG